MPTYLLFALTCLGLVADLSQAAEDILCYPCRGEECQLAPDGCLYGMTRDACGWKVCAAGPGEPCGGQHSHLDRCGEGMSCKCGKCLGCSVVRLLSGIIECGYSNPFCLPNHLQSQTN